MNLQVGLEAALGIVLMIFIPIIGYFVRQLNRAVENSCTQIATSVARLDGRIDAVEAESIEARHALRGELSNIVLNEEVRRKEAVQSLESRFNTTVQSLEVRFNVQIERVIMLINTKHDDSKRDMRVIQEDVRALLTKDRN